MQSTSSTNQFENLNGHASNTEIKSHLMKKKTESKETTRNEINSTKPKPRFSIIPIEQYRQMNNISATDQRAQGEIISTSRITGPRTPMQSSSQILSTPASPPAAIQPIRKQATNMMTNESSAEKRRTGPLSSGAAIKKIVDGNSSAGSYTQLKSMKMGYKKLDKPESVLKQEIKSILPFLPRNILTMMKNPKERAGAMALVQRYKICFICFKIQMMCFMLL